MDKKERKQHRKVLIKERVPSDTERQRDEDMFEKAILKNEYDDLGIERQEPPEQKMPR